MKTTLLLIILLCVYVKTDHMGKSESTNNGPPDLVNTLS